MDAAFKPVVNGELDTQNFMKFDEVKIRHLKDSKSSYALFQWYHILILSLGGLSKTSKNRIWTVMEGTAVLR